MEEEAIPAAPIPVPVPVPEGKIYTEGALWGATFLGGPLAAGYVIASNFKVFNEPENVKKTWIYTAVVTLIIVVVLYLLRNVERFPNVVIPACYTSLAYYFMKSKQQPKIDSHVSAGGKKRSVGNIILVSLISMVVFIVPVLAGFTLTDKRMFADSKEYGLTENKIYYDAKLIDGSQVDFVADVLTSTEFFSNDHQGEAYIDKEADNYLVYLPVNDGVWNDSKYDAVFEDMKKQMQVYFPNNGIVLILCADFDDEKKRI